MLGSTLLANIWGSAMMVSVEIIGILALFLALGFYAWRTNKGRSAALLVGSIVGTHIYVAFSSLAVYSKIFSNEMQGMVMDISILILFILLATYILQKYIHGKFSADRKKKIVQILIWIVTTMGVITSQFVSVIDISERVELSHYFYIIFASSYATTIWLLLGMSILFVLRGKR